MFRNVQKSHVYFNALPSNIQFVPCLIIVALHPMKLPLRTMEFTDVGLRKLIWGFKYLILISASPYEIMLYPDVKLCLFFFFFKDVLHFNIVWIKALQA